MRGTPRCSAGPRCYSTASNAGGVHSHLHIASCALDVYPTKFSCRHSVVIDSKTWGQIRAQNQYISESYSHLPMIVLTFLALNIPPALASICSKFGAVKTMMILLGVAASELLFLK